MDKKLIEDALKKAGLSLNLADQIKATTQEELDAEIEKLKVKPGPKTQEEFEKLYKDNEFFKKALQSESDRRVQEAIKTREENLRKEKEEADKLEAEEKAKLEKNKDMSDTDKKLEDLTTRNTKLEKMFEELMGKTKGEQIEGLRKQKLKDAGLDERLYRRLFKESDTEIDSEISELKEILISDAQKIADKQVKELGKPMLSKGKGDNGVLTEVKSYAKKKADTSSTGLASTQLKSKGEI